jgi:hypothetical protein
MEQPSSSQTKSLKRLRELSTIITDTRSVKKNCRLVSGAISIPKNASGAYRDELRRGLFYTFYPSDKTSVRYAKRTQVWDRAIYGCNRIGNIEKLVLDDETKIPWTVPKVTREFKRIDYVKEQQQYSVQASLNEGLPVSPKTITSVEQMSRDEYEDAIEAGDSRVAIEGKHLFEFCRDTEIEWLRYEDR